MRAVPEGQQERRQFAVHLGHSVQAPRPGQHLQPRQVHGAGVRDLAGVERHDAGKSAAVASRIEVGHGRIMPARLEYHSHLSPAVRPMIPLVPPLLRFLHPARRAVRTLGQAGAAVHGTGYCTAIYWPLLSRLQRHFDLVTSDVQGHGDSDHGGRFHGWNRSAKLALEAWHRQRRDYGDVPHYAAGHSFGGVITALCWPRSRGSFSEPSYWTRYFSRP